MKLPTNAPTTIGAAFVLMVTTLQTTAVERDAGVQQIAVRSQERETDLDVTVGYPASSGGEVVLLGEDAFFEGTEATLPFRTVQILHT